MILGRTLFHIINYMHQLECGNIFAMVILHTLLLYVSFSQPELNHILYYSDKVPSLQHFVTSFHVSLNGN